MATHFRPFIPRWQPDNDTGAIVPSGLLFIYTAGTSTKKNIFQDNAGAVANSNPIVLNSAGRLPNSIWTTTGDIKVVFSPSDDTDPPTNAFWTEDDWTLINDTSTAVSDEWVDNSLTTTFVSATSWTFSGDQTTAFHVGRRVRITDTGGTIYGTIATSAYVDPTTTLTVNLDSGTIDSGISKAVYGIVSFTNPSIKEQRLTKGAIGGLVVSIGTDTAHDINISVGSCRNDDDDNDIRLTTALTGKQLDVTFGAGSSAGALANGVTLPTDGTIHIWLVTKDDGGARDVMGDTSATGANVSGGSSGYTAEKRIASLLTNAGDDNLMQVIPLERSGGAVEYTITAPVLDVDVSNLGDAESLYVVGPTGFKFEIHGNAVAFKNAAQPLVWIYSPDVTSDTPVASGATPLTTIRPPVDGNSSSGGTLRVRTDTSGQIAARASVVSTEFDWVTTGWTDWR